MASPRIVAALVRHGVYEQPEHVPSAHLPHPLTDQGRRQARDAAGGLAQWAVAEGTELAAELDSSPLLRAWETAGLLRDGLAARLGRDDAAVVEAEALAERSLGAAANLTMQQIADVVARDPRLEPLPARWKPVPEFRLPLLGAESLLEAGARCGAWIERRLAELADSAARPTLKVFVGHGGAFRFAAVALGVLSRDEAVGLSMHHCAPVFLERRAPDRYAHVGGEWKVRRVAGPADGGEDG